MEIKIKDLKKKINNINLNDIYVQWLKWIKEYEKVKGIICSVLDEWNENVTVKWKDIQDLVENILWSDNDEIKEALNDYVENIVPVYNASLFEFYANNVERYPYIDDVISEFWYTSWMDSPIIFYLRIWIANFYHDMVKKMLKEYLGKILN